MSSDAFKALAAENAQQRDRIRELERQLAGVECFGTAPCGCSRKLNNPLYVCDCHNWFYPTWDAARAVQRFLEWCGDVE